MFGWVQDLIDGIAEAITSAFEFVFEGLAEKIWTAMLQWFYVTIFDAVADFFTYINSMGADVFSLSWVEATVKLFTLFGWALFVAGIVVAVFELAIEYQSGGRANIKTTALNFLKGFFACSLIGVLPIELYKFCITLQNTFSGDLVRLFATQQHGVDGKVLADYRNCCLSSYVAEFDCVCILHS